MSTSETLSQIVKLIGGVVQVLLGLNAILKLLGALPTTELFKFIYDVSDPLKSPFNGIFPSIVFGERFTLDLTVLFAMVAYLIITLIFVKLIVFVFDAHK